MTTEKYKNGFPRQRTKIDPKTKKPIKYWQGVLKYKEPNPDFVEAPESGEDTRTAKQKQRETWKQITKTFNHETVKTKSQANKALQAWKEEEEQKAAQSDSTRVLVPAYVSYHISVITPTIEPSTIKGYQTTLKHIEEEFKNTYLQDLTGRQINDWLNKLRDQNLSVTTVKKCYGLLNKACKAAVIDGTLTINPCDKAQRPKSPKAKLNALTDSSRKKLSTILSVMEPTPLCVASYLGTHMGMRLGEICGLKWKDISFQRETISISRSIGRGTGENYTYVKDTKNNSSTRVLPIVPTLLPILKARKILMIQDLTNMGITMNDDEFGELFVIGYCDGRFKNPVNLSKEWKTLAESYGLIGEQGEICTFHDTRHTFATVAIAQGTDVMATASFMGHSDPTTTLRNYANADENAKRAAAANMASAWESMNKSGV